MLDTQTKRRIDDCRDILVGKLPDPKAQIEQITIGLIYKFMDDMDKEAIELGGSAKYFSGDYEKYAWDKLFDTKVTATEMLSLYSEAIESMEKNPNIPQLFRDIFKNAYLPYRSAETLKLFLKTIGEFEYTHSEKLGDAFEYLLSVMGSQGDAGQFRTPRHIIDFLVAIIDPDKGETILDPACGTAGFLISAYKHILLKHTKANKEGLNIYEYNKLEKKPFNNLGDQLTPDDRKKLIQNFAGYDISPDMVRLSLVNLYLHGFSDPHINEYDTLSSEDRWNENFDVVLANPPFMSPKGGIRPHKKFTINSNRSEVLFVDYIAEHLNPNGKAAIVVPEGILFQNGNAYKELRKLMLSNHLVSIMSLPSGVFNPYSGVKTSILVFDNQISKKTDNLLFIKINNDGFSLGSQRTEINGSELSKAVSIYHSFKDNPQKPINSEFAHVVAKKQIFDEGNLNLNGNKYRELVLGQSEYPIFELQELFEIQRGGSPRPIKDFITENEDGINWIKIGDAKEGSRYITETKEKIKPEGLKKSRLVNPGDFILSNSMSFGRPYISQITGCIHDGWLVFKTKEENIITDYIYYILSSQFVKDQFEKAATGGVVKNLNINLVKEVKIPVPPIEVQQKLIDELENIQVEIQQLEKKIEDSKTLIQESIAKIWGVKGDSLSIAAEPAVKYEKA